MNRYCFVHCFGKSKVPDEGKWKNNVFGGVNRLYFILDGQGGYIRNGEKKHFKKSSCFAFGNVRFDDGIYRLFSEYGR